MLFLSRPFPMLLHKDNQIKENGTMLLGRQYATANFFTFCMGCVLQEKDNGIAYIYIYISHVPRCPMAALGPPNALSNFVGPSSSNASTFTKKAFTIKNR